MNKKLLIKLIIVLVVASLVYSVFWFLKVSQIEKQISKFINQNNAYVSVGEISISGFPLNQNITLKNLKFTIPNPAISGNQIIVRHLEAKAAIFDTEFEVNIERDVTVQTLEGKTSNVAFAKSPRISASIVNGMISSLNYQDEGYKIQDTDQTLIYSAASTSFSANIMIGDNEKIITKITANVKDVEGFDIIDIYSNAFEKGIIDGIKTGEIVLGNLPMDTNLNEVGSNQNLDIKEGGEVVSNALSQDGETLTAIPLAESQAKAVTDIAVDKIVQNDVAKIAEAKTDPANLQAVPAVSKEVDPKVISAVKLPEVGAKEKGSKGLDVDPTLIEPDLSTQEVVNQAVNQDIVPGALLEALDNEKIVEKIVKAKPVKNNFIVNVEYILSPNQTAQDIDVPFDPTQIQDIPVQYSKSIKINNVEVSNANYTITIGGNMNSLPDDGFPSGDLVLKINHIDKLTQYLSQSFADISVGKDIGVDEVQAFDLMENEIEEDNSYNDFLMQVSIRLKDVAKELAEKNALTKEDVAQFNIKREKNLDFLVNESSVREILGKF